MSPISKRRSRPDRPDAVKSTMDQLETLLEKENSVTPYLELFEEIDEVTATSRNQSINVLRCLKMWFDLSSEAFIVAVNIVDRFLTKMKVQTRHIPCVSVSSLYIASELLNENVNPEDLINISQTNCTSRDLLRMSNIIREKLDLHDDVPVTAFSFLRFFYTLLRTAADKLKLGNIFDQVINEQEMYMQLEIISCDVHCSSDLPSVIGLSLIFTQIEQFISGPNFKQLYARRILNLYGFAAELKKFCNVNDCEFSQCFKKVLSVLNLYNGELKVPYRQRLIWRVSNRTMKKLRPTKQLRYILPTIIEDTTHILH